MQQKKKPSNIGKTKMGHAQNNVCHQPDWFTNTKMTGEMLKKKVIFCLRFEFNRRVEVLEQDEKLKENIAPEVRVAKLQFQ